MPLPCRTRGTPQSLPKTPEKSTQILRANPPPRRGQETSRMCLPVRPRSAAPPQASRARTQEDERAEETFLSVIIQSYEMSIMIRSPRVNGLRRLGFFEGV